MVRFGRQRVYETGALVALVLTGLLLMPHPAAHARSAATPWSREPGYQQLVYGASSPWDVQQAVGTSPDEVVRSPEMFPVVENHYYYEENGSGAATVFVFENQLLVGMHYRSPDNQWVDLTYFLTNIGDRSVNNWMRHGHAGYYPDFGFYSWY